MMTLFSLTRKIHYSHRKSRIPAQDFSQSHANCFLISFDRSMCDWYVGSAPQFNRVKVEILRNRNFLEQHKELFVVAPCPLITLRISVLSANIERVEVDAASRRDCLFCICLALASKSTGTVKRNVNHVQRLDMCGSEPSGTRSHKGLKDSILHPFFGLFTFHPLLGLHSQDRSQEDRSDREPFTKTNRRFFCCHISSIIAKRKIIA